MIAAPVNVAVHSATTCGNCSWVVISGGIERRAGASIASAAPIAAAIANSGTTVVRVVLAVQREGDGAHAAGEDEHRAHPATVEAVGHPAADEHEQHGRDELGETEQADRRASSPVMSYACLNSTVTIRLRPIEPNAVEKRYCRTARWRRTSRALLTRRRLPIDFQRSRSRDACERSVSGHQIFTVSSENHA